jgi:hypothetical protein
MEGNRAGSGTLLVGSPSFSSQLLKGACSGESRGGPRSLPRQAFSRGRLSDFLAILRVRTVLPSSIDTAFYPNARNYTGRVILPEQPVYGPERVAKEIVEAVAGRQDHHRLEHGRRSKASSFLRRAVSGLSWGIADYYTKLTKHLRHRQALQGFELLAQGSVGLELGYRGLLHETHKASQAPCHRMPLESEMTSKKPS